jgi:PTS system mannose-specific IID component
MPAFGRVLLRLFTVQASWNYDRLQGIGFGHAAEPALRALDGGPTGTRYHEALAREARFFNAHPYLAGLAVGAAVRSELDGTPPERTERLREALCGPLGSIGDRMFWASCLPICAMLGLIAYVLGAGVWSAAVFLVPYNAAHLACRVWGLRQGWARGHNVVGALQSPVLRLAGRVAAPAAGLVLGAGVPIVLSRQLAGTPTSTALPALIGVLVLAVLLRVLGARLTGLRLTMLVLGLTFIAGLVW